MCAPAWKDHLVTVKEYIKANRHRERDVLSWLKKGRLRGVTRDEQSGETLVARYAKPLYFVRRSKDRSISYLLQCLLDALNKRMMIDAEVLGVSPGDFNQCIQIALESKLIARDTVGYDGIENSGYRLTAKGIEFCESHNTIESRIEAIKDLVQPLAHIMNTVSTLEGVTM